MKTQHAHPPPCLALGEERGLHTHSFLHALPAQAGKHLLFHGRQTQGSSLLLKLFAGSSDSSRHGVACLPPGGITLPDHGRDGTFPLPCLFHGLWLGFPGEAGRFSQAGGFSAVISSSIYHHLHLLYPSIHIFEKAPHPTCHQTVVKEEPERRTQRQKAWLWRQEKKKALRMTGQAPDRHATTACLVPFPYCLHAQNTPGDNCWWWCATSLLTLCHCLFAHVGGRQFSTLGTGEGREEEAAACTAEKATRARL